MSSGSPNIGVPPKKTTWIWIVAIVAGCFLCVCPMIVAAILFPVFRQAKLHAQNTVQLSNAKMVDVAMLLYSSDFDDKLPDLGADKHVGDILMPYLEASKSRLLTSTANGYAWNEKLSRVDTATVVQPESVWLFHARTPDPDSRTDLGYLDGHVRRVGQSELATIVAQPVRFEKRSDQ